MSVHTRPVHLGRNRRPVGDVSCETALFLKLSCATRTHPRPPSVAQSMDAVKLVHRPIKCGIREDFFDVFMCGRVCMHVCLCVVQSATVSKKKAINVLEAYNFMPPSFSRIGLVNIHLNNRNIYCFLYLYVLLLHHDIYYLF